MGQLLTAEPDRARVIVFWSLECSYCQEELQWLAGRDGSEAEVVLVATDPVTSAEAVSTRLRKYGFEPARHWIFAEAFVERLRYDVDPGWGGELPRTYLVAAGEEPIGVSGRLDRERFDAWLQSVTGD
ncbi:hypothetical protein TspCOW1_18280 [Thiohalobacter sp. COW1]|uniref:Thioredoxin domain-containing protein n=2 Tax=Thiohalobacter TaxID=1273155 RepID=A0A1Z4VNN6_9GAMM|nr:uncharacterized protein FOKN1_0844 [Thiohalobacter thiocyanaticus]BCO31725.1 hypothetical protein TspCOW1_18280 [Thiohalobacter sp. COW1]